MLRESTDKDFQNEILAKYPELNKDFVFIAAAHNFRSTELNAILGISQLKRLDENNVKRRENFDYFMQSLDKDKYHTDLELEGQSNYAFIVILKMGNMKSRDLVEETLKSHGIEFRRGLSGGGSQMKQPYLQGKIENNNSFLNIEHIHHYSWYIGNYPTLEKEKITELVRILNSINV
jgi:CDP-6-deoxy-D-xylo-4-hexulose-3-dehydrase